MTTFGNDLHGVAVSVDDLPKLPCPLCERDTVPGETVRYVESVRGWVEYHDVCISTLCDTPARLKRHYPRIFTAPRHFAGVS